MELRGQFLVLKLPIPGETALTVAVDPENRPPGGVSVLFDKEFGATGALDLSTIVLGVEFHRLPTFA
jgi:hypothetical protein